MPQKFSKRASLVNRSGTGLGVAILLGGLTSLAMPAGVAIGQTTDPTVAAGQVTSSRPPAGFDPLTASDDELQRYGFPPRPDAKKAPEAYTQWQKLVVVPRTGNPKLQPTRIYDGPALKSQ
jgi:hypothetical protein